MTIIGEPLDASQSGENIIAAAVEAVRRGYQPIPIHKGRKNPGVSQWTRLRWSASRMDEVRDKFRTWKEDGYSNLGLMLGEPSGNLIDVDLDHPKTMRLKDLILPPTAMRTGRAGRRISHYWYVCEEGTLPDTRRHKMPDGSVSVELRSDRAQTLIPPSIHPDGEPYLWEGEDWGGEMGPAVVDGRVLAVQVALLALGTVLVEHWPEQGGRHDAYLALAGGLLRYGDEGVHPYWERNAAILIKAVADATHDDDGPEVRAKESIGSTIAKLLEGRKSVGFSRLGEMLGEDVVQQVRRLVTEVESTAGFKGTPTLSPDRDGDVEISLGDELDIELEADGEVDDVDPLAQRETSWSRVDLDEYLSGRVTRATPFLMQRSDGKYLMYPARVNMLFGSSESAKSWVALQTCLQVLEDGGRVAYLDFEDDPSETVWRLLQLGAGIDDLRTQFAYFHPEEPHGLMQRNRWGGHAVTGKGKKAAEAFHSEMSRLNPTLIVADGMSVLYGLHGLDTNDTSNTDVITSWLKGLTKYHHNRAAVIVIDHTAKNSGKGVFPIGSQHKTSMVQGSLIQVWPVKQPMEGHLGELELIVVKDRPSGVRPFSGPFLSGTRSQVCAVVEVDSRKTDSVELRIVDPSKRAQPDPKANPEVDFQDSNAAHRMSRKVSQEHLIRRSYDEVGQGLTVSQLAKRSGLNEPIARKAADRMVGLGELVKQEVKTGGRGRPAFEFVLVMRDITVSDEDDEDDLGDLDEGADSSS